MLKKTSEDSKIAILDNFQHTAIVCEVHLHWQLKFTAILGQFNELLYERRNHTKMICVTPTVFSTVYFMYIIFSKYIKNIYVLMNKMWCCDVKKIYFDSDASPRADNIGANLVVAIRCYQGLIWWHIVVLFIDSEHSEISFCILLQHLQTKSHMCAPKVEMEHYLH